MKKLFAKIPYYVPLAGIYLLTFIAFYKFSYSLPFQKAVIVSAGLSHVVWGIVYHFIHRDLSSIVILEYVAIAVLGVSAVLSIL